MPTFKHPCPHCARYINRDVAACPYCGTADPFAPARCPKCHAPIEDPAWVSCPRCGQALAKPASAAVPALAPPEPVVPAGQPPSSGARRCTGCGAPLAEGARFCTACGTLAG